MAAAACDEVISRSWHYSSADRALRNHDQLWCYDFPDPNTPRVGAFFGPAAGQLRPTSRSRCPRSLATPCKLPSCFSRSSKEADHQRVRHRWLRGLDLNQRLPGYEPDGSACFAAYHSTTHQSRITSARETLQSLSSSKIRFELSPVGSTISTPQANDRSSATQAGTQHRFSGSPQQRPNEPRRV